MSQDWTEETASTVKMTKDEQNRLRVRDFDDEPTIPFGLVDGPPLLCGDVIPKKDEHDGQKENEDV